MNHQCRVYGVYSKVDRNHVDANICTTVSLQWQLSLSNIKDEKLVKTCNRFCYLKVIGHCCVVFDSCVDVSHD